MAFDLSLTNNFTPIRPHKIEQLFSPNLLSPKIAKSDMTYQIPHLPLDNGDTNTRPRANYRFPRQSTELRINIDPSKRATSLDKENESSFASISRIEMEDSVIETPYPQYKPFLQIKETQPIRATCFHPSGEVFAIGSNSKTLRICSYPTEEEFNNANSEDTPIEPHVAFMFIKIHRGSIYCAKFNKAGNLLATGSNDQAVHIVKYDHKKRIPVGSEYKLQTHTGTVRDLCFLNGSNEEDPSYLVSGGTGEFEICVTDCKTMKPVQVLHGHESSVMSLYCWGEANTFISGSLDGTIRLWDARSKLCIKTIGTNRLNIGDGKSPVGVVRVDDSGKLLVSGHQNGKCMLYDTKAGQVIQSFKAHDADIRTMNFSPKSYYLLSASYDNKVKLMDLQGDLSKRLPMVDVAELDDKVVQTVWHPEDYNFITTCADGTATLWTMPELTNTNNISKK